MTQDVLVLGGGFGGMYTANELADADNLHVTLINDSNYFLFQPMLHEVATGSISHRNIVSSLPEILGSNVDFCEETVTRVDLDENVVETTRHSYDYDAVVVALGSQTGFFGVPGAEEHSRVLKDIDDAFQLRNEVVDQFQRVSQEGGEVKAVLVGGGPTGVELGAELIEWMKRLCEVYTVSPDAVSVALVDRGEKVLGGIDERLRDYAMQTLSDKGINLRMESSVAEVTDKAVRLEDETELPCTLPVWTAGVQPADVPVNGVEKDRGRIPVEQDLSVQGHDDAFALGDIAGFSNPDGETFPPTAQLAYQQAFGAAKNVEASVNDGSTTPFTFVDKGFLASLGHGKAVAYVKGLRLYGFPAWFLWRSIYLTKLVGWQNTFRVMSDWTFDLFSKRDTSKIPYYD